MHFLLPELAVSIATSVAALAVALLVWRSLRVDRRLRRLETGLDAESALGVALERGRRIRADLERRIPLQVERALAGPEARRRLEEELQDILADETFFELVKRIVDERRAEILGNAAARPPIVIVTDEGAADVPDGAPSAEKELAS